MNLMEKMMFTVYRSRLDFGATVTALKDAAVENGWRIPMVHDLQESYQEAGYEDMSRVTVLYFCNPDGGYKILQDDAHKPMSVMMPMGVSVYETQDGGVYVAGMDLGRMSMMFGGTVKEVLEMGALNYARTLEPIAEREPTSKVSVDPKGCCAGCLALSAVLAAIMALLVAVMVKFLPKLMVKMMSTMMPRVMERMEEAGVQPPCAQIILERMASSERE